MVFWYIIKKKLQFFDAKRSEKNQAIFPKARMTGAPPAALSQGPDVDFFDSEMGGFCIQFFWVPHSWMASENPMFP